MHDSLNGRRLSGLPAAGRRKHVPSTTSIGGGNPKMDPRLPLIDSRRSLSLSFLRKQKSRQAESVLIRKSPSTPVSGPF